MATQMTALVLNDEKEQIKTNTLYQKIVDSNPTADLESASEQMNVLYKTELCRSWQFGQCKDRLIFAIYDSELRNWNRQTLKVQRKVPICSRRAWTEATQKTKA